MVRFPRFLLVWTSLVLALPLAAQTPVDRGLRIGIVGAGPAGLVAAADLQDRGFRDVTVLEAADQVGGKVRSLAHEGYHYELGAVVIAKDNGIVHGLARELGQPLAPAPGSLELSPEGEVGSFLSYAWQRHGLWASGAALYRFHRFVQAWPDYFQPGFAATPPCLGTTFEQFMHDQGIAALADQVRPVMVGCGYGYAEDMPAAYWMKLMKTFAYDRVRDSLNLTGGPFFQSFPAGWQNLWAAFAERRNLQVRLRTPVDALVRAGTPEAPRVEVRSGSQAWVFDRVVVTVPHLAGRFMDLDEDERRLFAGIHTLTYKVTLLELRGLPPLVHLWPRAYSTKVDGQGRPNDGNVVLLANVHPTGIYHAYQFTGTGKTSAELLRQLQDNLARMRVTAGKVVAEAMYEYFPHFDAQACAQGYPRKLIELQGRGGVYFTGALMNFETVELAAQHARQLVEQCFP